MQLTPNFRLRKPDGTDPVDVQDFNDNADVIDTNLAGKLDKTGDASNAVAKFSQAGSRTNLTSGEKLSLSLGKVMKWFADLKTVAFSGSYSDLSGKPSIPSGTAASCGVANNDTTTASGFVADARIVKIHGDEIDTLNQNLGGLNFKEEAGIKYVRGADAVWVPLGSLPEIINYKTTINTIYDIPTKSLPKIIIVYFPNGICVYNEYRSTTKEFIGTLREFEGEYTIPNQKISSSVYYWSSPVGNITTKGFQMFSASDSSCVGDTSIYIWY